MCFSGEKGLGGARHIKKKKKKKTEENKQIRNKKHKKKIKTRGHTGLII